MEFFLLSIKIFSIELCIGKHFSIRCYFNQIFKSRYSERSKLSVLRSRGSSSKINPFDAKANTGIFYETLKTALKLIKVL